MKTFSIDTDNAVTAFASAAQADEAGGFMGLFTSANSLAEVIKDYPMKRIVEVWNGIPGVKPVSKFENRTKAANRIWAAVQSLTPAPEETADAEPQAPRARSKAKGARERGDDAPRRQARHAKAITQGDGSGSKKDQAIAMMRRPQGATNAELMQAFGWQTHTVRGFVAGMVSKKLGLNVESFKDAAGERAYRITEAK